MEFFILSIQFVRSIDISGRTKYNYYVIFFATLNLICLTLYIYGESKSKKITVYNTYIIQYKYFFVSII